ncbi:MAG: bifunctional diaminohydroxyphosphoribosylaminopyrimidine deaminase/5-amino-6-(5-phosphoribosylamino)uracil reductase RibD [Negativicoccus succinicivorans]|uniref:bifunctional diaminohydroxyphosphoribosylaminopyrimidine deaminase/5-amino-6-(5-phosphoribosylamino)uracil reductase RibD n=1 Tax=Negativicoccus succinicivorans TaxID=620903 RepID=UPI0029062686|nr:bifunctional diaminohydroxyphosphoribosylaminopyrimidine deaminase/5-amino-6-(5-phosphoribosylamino)uracil reductase RibD [Negativicoccus succinicivorans]MDU5396321.1 bifunctional diaminohydroxyphosphoribosylaminopyrimidine deaminase/5-amino-6-(5-phosphoribosylamino)uracil reductase RibD [Negativicoccus succinicivorans]
MQADISKEDVLYMERALQLAQLGTIAVRPNPFVGAVVVKNHTIVGEGWHQKAGGPHAEIWALQAAGEESLDATLYVTLEPCSHYGKTPPCTTAIIAAGIKRVVCACRDPFRKVNGNGITTLEEAGIEVVCGVCEEEARKINRGFFRSIEQKRPQVIAKMATTLDGKTATVTGESQWITGKEARHDVQRLRSLSDAITVGINTVLADDPQLTVRDFPCSNQPWRVIWDKMARLPLTATMVTQSPERTILFCTQEASPDRLEALRQQKVNVELLPYNAEGEPDIRAGVTLLLEKYAIQTVLLEGGATLIDAFLRAALLDEIYLYIAPLMIGGTTAKGISAGVGIETLKNAPRYTLIDTQMFADDIRLHYEVKEFGCLPV